MGDEWFTLPDGSPLYIPANATREQKDEILKDIAGKFPGYFTAPYAETRVTEPTAEGNILGAIWQGAGNIPRGFASVPLMTAQGIAALLTPHKDTGVEKNLRRAEEWLYSGMDPRYAEGNLSKLGLGLGQAAGFILGGELGAVSGAARGLPAWLSARGVPAFLASNAQRTAGAAALGAGVNTGDAARRIAEYEERTGEDVGMFKELGALLPGTAMGLTEAFPLYGIAGATGILGPAVRRRLLTEGAEGLTPGLFRGALKAAAGEALQESGVELGQTVVARALYDDEALNDLGADIWDAAIIGGEVGGLLSILTNLASRPLSKRLSGTDYAAETSIRKWIRERDLDETSKRPLAGAVGNLDPKAADVTPEQEAKVASILELSPKELQERKNRHIELHKEAMEKRGDPFSQFYEGAPAEVIEQEAARRADLDIAYEIERAQSVEAGKEEIRPIVGMSFAELDALGSQPIQEILDNRDKADGVRSELILDVFTADRISQLGQTRRNELKRFIIKSSSVNNRYSSGAVAGAVAGSWPMLMGQQTEEQAANLFGGRDVPIEERERNAAAYLAKAFPVDSDTRRLLETEEFLSPEEVNSVIEAASQALGGTAYAEDGRTVIKGLDVDRVWDMVYGFQGGVDLFKSIQDRLPELANRWTQDATGTLTLRMSDPVAETENALVKKVVEKNAWDNAQKTKQGLFDLLQIKRVRLPLRDKPGDRKGAAERKNVAWNQSGIVSLIRSVTGVDSIEAANPAQRKALLGHVANLPRMERVTVLPDMSAPDYTTDHLEAFITYLGDGKSHSMLDISKSIQDGEVFPAEMSPEEAYDLMFNDTKALQLLRHAVEAGYVTSNLNGTKVTLNENSRPQGPTAGMDTSDAKDAAEAADMEESAATNVKSLTELEKRVVGFTEDFKARLKRMGLKDVDLILTAEAGSMMESVEGVIASPENMRGAYAMLDGPVARIMVNLSAVDPNNTLTSKEIVDNHLNEEIWHAYRRYGFMYQHEWDTLRSYGLQNVVAPKVSEDANKRGLNYVEWALEQADAQNISLNREDAVEEGVTILMDNLARGNLPRSKTAGKVGTIRDKMVNFAKNAIEAGRAANIEDVFSVYQMFETGKIGRRGAGFGRLSEDVDKVRSLYYSEYADPEMLDQLKAAIIEKDEAKQTKIAQQIADEKVVVSRASTLPAQMSTVDKILNRVMLDRTIGDTTPGEVPLLGKHASDLALDEIFRHRAGAPAYEMPSAIKYKLRKQDKWSPSVDLQDLKNKYLPGNNNSELLPGEILIQSSPYMGSTFGETKAAYQKIQEKFLGLFPKSRQGWRDLTLDRSINLEMQEQELTGLHGGSRTIAEQSAIAAVRFRDNAQNFLDSVLEDGNMTYVDSDGLGTGFFKVIPDGEKTLGEVFAMLRGPETREYFKMFSIAKRMQPKILKKDLQIAESKLAAHIAVEGQLNQDVENAGFTGPFAVEEYLEQNPAPEGYMNPANLEFWTNRTKSIKASFEGKSKDAPLIEEAEAREIISNIEAEAPHVAEAWNEYQRLNNNLIDWSLSIGWITPEMAEVYREDGFVPFYRDIGMVSAWPLGSNGTNRHKADGVAINTLRQADGSTTYDNPLRDSYNLGEIDVIAGIYQNHLAAIRDGMTNVAAYRAVRDARELTENGFGIQARRVTEAGPDTLRIVVDGQVQYWQMADPQIVQSVMMLGYSPANVFMRLMRGAGNLLRATIINFPDFIARNLMRDGQQSFVTYAGPDGTDPMLPLVSSLQKVFDSDALVEARRAGIATGRHVFTNPADYLGEFDMEAGVWNTPKGPKGAALTKRWGRRLGAPGSRIEKTGMPEPVELALDYASAAWNSYEDLRDRSEMASRMAVYDRTFAATGSEAQAALDGLEIMNYGRRGSSSMLNAIMAGVPFMSGTIQGTDVVYRTLFGHPDVAGATHSPRTLDEIRNRAWIRAMTLMGIGFTYAMLKVGDDEYESEDEIIKMNNWMIPLVGTDLDVKIPTAFTIGSLFKVLPEALVRYSLEEGYDFDDLKQEGRDQLARNLDVHLVPQVVRPLMNAWANKDEFQREKIVPTWLEDMPAELQKTKSTSATADAIAQSFGWVPEGLGGGVLGSPMIMENLIRQYFGTAGLYVSMIIDKLIGAVAEDNVAGTRQDWSRVDNWPVARAFLERRGAGSGRDSEYWELSDLVGAYQQRVAALEEEGDMDALREFMEANRGVATIAPAVRSMGRYLRNYRNRIDVIKESNLPHERKKELLDDLIAQKNERLKDVARLDVLVPWQEKS